MNIKFDKDKIMARLRVRVKAAVAASAIDLQTDIKGRLNQKASNILSGGIASAPGESPAKGSGQLANSIAAVDATTDANTPHYRVGTNVKYARIQEYGGRIHAKKGKFLAIPVGVDGRRAARDANGDLRRLKLRLVRTKGGQLLLVKDLFSGDKAAKGGTKAKGAQTVILFVLKKSVYLPSRPYMRPAYNAKKEAIKTRVAAAIASVLKGAA